MFSIAILIGIYSYIIFSLGLSGILYRQSVILITLGYVLLILVLFKFRLSNSIKVAFDFIKKIKIRQLLRNKFLYSILLLILLQSVVNFIGTLGPELGFDALWYHLTLPRIYLMNHFIFHIPGGLLYYSDMPKLGEMLYVSALAFNGEIMAKLIHFMLGILSCIAIYKLSRKFLSQAFSLLAVLIFYSNLVVAWESIAAYVDLARTFFEIMALWGFVNWSEKFEKKWLIKSAVILGLAISAKLLAIGSLIIFSILILYMSMRNKTKNINAIKQILTYWVISLLIALPWFMFSFINTGNPIYPFFTSYFHNVSRQFLNLNLLNPIHFISTMWSLFTRASDPVSPIYIIVFPIVIYLLKKFNFTLKIISIYTILGLCFWYLTSNIEGSRLLISYLASFSIIIAITLDLLNRRKNIFNVVIYKFIILIIVSVGISSIFYRTAANSKYIPVLLGRESKTQFLSRNLNFSFGDFYDTDRFFKNHIKFQDKVLLYGFHNLYYVDFSFIDSSWVKKGDRFNYIAIQNGELPKRFSYWELIYQNPKTHVKLYSMGGKEWVY